MKKPPSKPSVDVDKGPKPPGHLQPATKAWWTQLVEEYDLQSHHLRLLSLAGECWDRCQQAREAIDEHGLVFLDKAGQPRARPEVAVERDSRIAFARLLRELNLDSEPPPDVRVPRLLGGS
jgi:phage terminase small subunit